MNHLVFNNETGEIIKYRNAIPINAVFKGKLYNKSLMMCLWEYNGVLDKNENTQINNNTNNTDNINKSRYVEAIFEV